MSAENSSSRPGKQRLLIVAALLVMVAAGVGGVLWWLRKPPPPEVDMTAVLKANNAGVGRMERFEYAKAIEAFEEVRRLAPDWWPGRVNLGIALLNQAGALSQQQRRQKDELFERSLNLFRKVLEQEPQNKEARAYAHYCTGIIFLNQGLPEKAQPHLEKFIELVPDDAHGRYKYGLTINHKDPKRAAEYFAQAIKLNPNLGGAVYAYYTNPHVVATLSVEERKEKLALFKKLSEANLYVAEKDRYSELGKYCEVIGRVPSRDSSPACPPPKFTPPEKLQVKLAEGARWATADDFDDLPESECRKSMRKRFGAAVVFLDYNGDGKRDVFIPAAVVEDGKLRNLLLRNDGARGFTDATAAAKLTEDHGALACTVADFDNDGRPDLFLSGAGGLRLYRNKGDGSFDDVTAEAGLDKAKGFFLGAGFVDLDQDGDLDLLIARYADDAQIALVALKGEKQKPSGRLAVFLNVAEAKPVNPGTNPPPLEPRFSPADDATLQGKAAGVTGLAASDVDLDSDLDLVTLADRAAPELVLNDRLLRFRRTALPEKLTAAGTWNGALVLDLNNDERSDLLLVSPDRAPVLLMRRSEAQEEDAATWFTAGAVRSPPLRQAHAIDLDLDGRTDVIGLSASGNLIVLHNDGKHLVTVSSALGLEEGFPNDLIAAGVTDLNGDTRPDIVAWSGKEGLWAAVQEDNGNRALGVRLAGHRRIDTKHGGDVMRTNADGIGTRVMAHAADHFTTLEYTTLSAGLGQSRQPITLGLGKHSQAQTLRLRWPDNVWQAEFNFDAGRVHAVGEINRKTTSCPILFAWDGRRFSFVTDFLGAGTLGETQADGSHRQPRPEESIKIEAGQLRPRDGEFILKLAEPMDEITYLDYLQLIVLDHPAGAAVYPDERLATAGPMPTQDLLSFERRIFPMRASNHRGADVTKKLLARDRDMIDEFARRAWVGFAEEHAVELDFGDRLQAFGPDDRLFLFLAGWTDYAYPESIWAARQAGVPVQAPVLERKGDNGQWHKVAEVGFPAGLLRMMTYDLTGKLMGKRCVLRLRTNLRVYWDQIFIAPVVDRVPPASLVNGDNLFKLFRAAPLEVGQANLRAYGVMQEFSPDGKPPTLYDYDRLAPMPVVRQTGRLTRFGEVTKLLCAADDRFVVFGPGDDLEVRFDARELPPLPKGWRRSYVLRACGYCKGANPFTATGATVGPLPFRAMSAYPYPADEHYPNTLFHREYLRKYQTRQVGPRP